MMDSFNKNRNVDGYIDIDSLPKKTVARPTYGSRKNKLWFESNGELFLFKRKQRFLIMLCRQSA